MHLDGSHGVETGVRAAGRPLANTHVHVPPNFSAFDDVEDAVRAATAEGVRVMGVSNFHDHRIYGRFADAAREAGIVPLFGVELISVDDVLLAAGTKVNDPGNPGRVYLCGKGASPFRPRSATAEALMNRARAADSDRMRRMVPLLRDRFADAGLRTGLTDESIAEDVAVRAGVPREWVVLQERHVAQAFQEALFVGVEPRQRAAVLEAAFGEPSAVAVEDAVAVQGEIRARLMKSGRHAFVPESPVPFADAYRLVLELDAIPCYPTLADGATPTCPWETPPEALAERVLARGIHAAELIPIRNQPAVVEAYVTAFRAAGLIVTAGTEHNTSQRISMEPLCADGSRPSEAVRDIFWEGTCVVAAHQWLRAEGRPGFTDAAGRPSEGYADAETRIRSFAELGAELIAGAPGLVAR